jgi:hypothetical protein
MIPIPARGNAIWNRSKRIQFPGERLCAAEIFLDALVGQTAAAVLCVVYAFPNGERNALG